MSRSEVIYVFLVGMFIMILVLTNIIGTKLFVLPVSRILPLKDQVLTTGIITYPFTFWFTDVVSEIWGRRRADLMVYFGFFASLCMLGILLMAKTLPPAEIWRIGGEYAPFFHPDHYIRSPDGSVRFIDSAAAQAAYAFTFDAPGMLLFASMTAYLVAQLTDNRLFHFWRRVTREKHLWVRNNGSTIISQLIDTIIVNGIFLGFYWKFDLSLIIDITVSVYGVKVILALLDTPFIYAGVTMIRKLIDPRSES